MAEFISQRELRKMERDRRRREIANEELELRNTVENERERRRIEKERRKNKDREMTLKKKDDRRENIDYDIGNISREITQRKEIDDGRELILQKDRIDEREIMKQERLHRKEELLRKDLQDRIDDLEHRINQSPLPIENLKHIRTRKEQPILDISTDEETNSSDSDVGQEHDREEEEHDFMKEMTWIDGKLKALKKENMDVRHTLPREDMHDRKKTLKETQKENLHSSFLQYDSCDEEQEIEERIKRLAIQENNLSKELEHKKARKENERRERREKELRRKRLEELKERERSLEESLLMKENLLSQLSSDEDDFTDWIKEEKIERKRKKAHQEERKNRAVSFKRPTIPKLTEDSFEEWKMEVDVILESGLYHDDIIRQEVRNSLTGNTRKILLNLKSNASTKELMTKLENLYGNIRSGESILAEFYKSKQDEKESVAEWGVRVESLLNTALRKGQILQSQADEMLRNRFWRFLKHEKLKNATRMFYETAKDFEELRRKVRIEENEMESETNMLNVRCQQMKEDGNEQMELMKRLMERMELLEEKLEKQELSRKQEQAGERKTEERNDGNRYRNGRGRWNGGYRGYRGNRDGYNRENNWRNRNDKQEDNRERKDSYRREDNEDSRTNDYDRNNRDNKNLNM